MHGVHRRLGTGVGETPQREPETLRQLSRNGDSILRRLGEMRAARRPSCHGLDDPGMAVPDGADALPAVKVPVLPAVDVVDLRPLAGADPDHLRTRDLPARGRPARENLPRFPDQSPRPRLTFLEPAFTLDDD